MKNFTSWKVPFIDYPASPLILPVICNPKKNYLDKYRSCEIPLSCTMAELLIPSKLVDHPCDDDKHLVEECLPKAVTLQKMDSGSTTIDKPLTSPEPILIVEPKFVTNTPASSPIKKSTIWKFVGIFLKFISILIVLCLFLIAIRIMSIYRSDVKDNPVSGSFQSIPKTASPALQQVKKEPEKYLDSQKEKEMKVEAVCTDGRLKTNQIIKLVENYTAYGTKLSKSGNDLYGWKEYQGGNGKAYFKKSGESYVSGKWKMDVKNGEAVICWCYGECVSYQCKYVEAKNDCSIWYYINPNTGEKTGKVNRWSGGDQTN